MALILIYFMGSFLPVQRSGTCLDVLASRHPVLAVSVSAFVFPAKFAPTSTWTAPHP
jgi:hypothetical protein